MGKQRREQPQDNIFANNPFVDGFFEWMGSREGQQCIEVRDVLWDLLEDVQLDAKQRQLPQLDELDSLTERWVADHLPKAKASKKRKRTRHS